MTKRHGWVEIIRRTKSSIWIRCELKSGDVEFGPMRLMNDGKSEWVNDSHPKVVKHVWPYLRMHAGVDGFNKEVEEYLKRYKGSGMFPEWD